MTVPSSQLSSGWPYRPCSLTRHPTCNPSGFGAAEGAALLVGTGPLLLRDIQAIKSEGSP
eukprot:3933579-Rhodomonas_salina.2